MESTTWELVRQERLTLADLVEPLSDEQWTTITLCTEWTVKDVIGHVTMTPDGEPRPWQSVKAMVSARGRMWTAARDVAVDYARRPREELVETLRRVAGSRRKPFGVVDDHILPDLVVHGQDIAVPLGLERPVPPDVGRITLDAWWEMGWPFHARRRLSGVRLCCEELAWEGGSGPEVVGSAGALALLMTGRTEAALSRLRGPGVATLSARWHGAASSR